MEIDNTNFWQKLPSIIKAISKAKYVAVDLAVSGTSPGQSRLMPLSSLDSLQSLQQMYDDTKAAAEMYSILQFGLTCVSWKPKSQTYVTKTFNVLAHPGVPKGKDTKQLTDFFDRQFKMSAVTLHKLMQPQVLDLGTVFDKGVPYFSEAEAKQKATSDFIEGRSQTKDHVKAGELPPKSREFYNSVTEKATRWDGNGQVQIRNPNPGPLNVLQTRLIELVAENELENCRATEEYGHYSMKIRKINATPKRQDQRRQAIRKQTGVRLLWDAITGKPFVDNIDLNLIVGDDQLKVVQLAADLKEYERRLQSKRLVFVGHELLWNLCFLYSNFVSPLPQSVDAFRAVVRECLPRIVDTRYLFTWGRDEMWPDQSLSLCHKSVRKRKFPAVRQDPAYGDVDDHLQQAGYESWRTAVVFIHKSYKMTQDIPSELMGEEDVRSRSASIVLSPSSSARSPTRLSSPKSPTLLREGDGSSTPAVTTIPEVSRTEIAEPQCDKDVMEARAELGVLRPDSCRPASSPTPPAQKGEAEREPKPEDKVEDPAQVPEWEETFWRKYGNTSRVGPFGLILHWDKETDEQAP
ncbi:hypothetical protein Daus18300_011506 [Diaporthe australafricana]|uniref:Uncharacterized protein n=1 Tax=Diaporthe australafricana TaxID=127596 RepID=A0ABR3W6D5_9PEZI